MTSEAMSPGQRSVEALVPLSSAQLGMWFAQQIAGDIPITIAQYVDVTGRLDADLLAAVCRTAALEVGSGMLRIEDSETGPTQFVDPDLSATVTVHDFRDTADPVAAAHGWMRGEAARPLDILKDPLVMSSILRVDDHRSYWFARSHHIALDGHGAMNFMNRAAELYTASVRGEAPAPCPAVAPAELTLAEQNYRASRRFDTDRNYWAEQTRNLPDPVSLARSGPAPLSAHPLLCGGALSESASHALERLADEVGTGTAPVIVAAFGAYVAALSGTEDLVLSLPVSGRVTVALRRSGGMMSNIVPLRLHVPADATIRDIIAAVRTKLTGALRHQRYRHEDIRRDRGAEPGSTGFFGPAVNIMMFHRQIQLGDLLGEFHVLSTGPVEDLSVNLYPSIAGGLTRIDFEANPCRYDKAELQGLHTRFLRMFEEFVTSGTDQRIGDLNLLDDHEKAELLPVRGPAGASEKTLPELLCDTASAHPDASALTGPGGSMTYAELDAASNRLARVLIRRGAGPETFVAVAAARSIDSVTAVWAVAKAGAAFVPVDPNYPESRVRHMLTDSGALLGLTVASARAHLSNETDWVILDSDELAELTSVQPDTRIGDDERTSPLRLHHLAYVVYTSGSTGTPKGVAVSHTGLHNFVVEQLGRYDTGPDSRILHVSSPSFDASVFEYLLAFGSGASLVIAPPDVYGGTELHALMARHRVSHAFLTPAPLASLAPHGLDCLTHLTVGGEIVPTELVQRWAPGRRLFVAYGPTETTIMAAISEPMRVGDLVDLGGPLRGTNAVVLDARLRPVPSGSVGELYLGGVGLARAYHLRPGLSASRFVADPWGRPGERLYRTGDLVRWQRSPRSGRRTLGYVGRSDFQVKIRGLRVELGEIDHVLTAHPAVGFGATLGVDGPNGTVLVAYVLPTPDYPVTPTELIDHLARTLPSHMVPSQIVLLDDVPLTPVGKLDRKALPAPQFGPSESSRRPATMFEEILTATVGEIVSVPDAGVDDSFFALGGNSLSATQLAARASTILGVDLTVRDVFEAPTAAGLAVRATELQATARRSHTPSERVPLVAGPRPEMVPLSLSQQRLWFLNRLDPASGADNIPVAIRLNGVLDVPALTTALHDVVGRHESLRTVYPDSADGPHQVIHPSAECRLELPVLPCSEATLVDALFELASPGFDLATETPVRAALLQQSGSEHVLVIVVHHVSADGWSMTALARDLMLAYGARSAGAAPLFTRLPVQYADFTLWQRARLGDEATEGSPAQTGLDYWQRTLVGLPEQIELPYDHSRPAVASYRGGSVRFTIDAATHGRLAVLAQEHDSTLFMVAHAALTLLLNRLGAGSDIAVGTPVAGRGAPELDDVVGMFVGTLVLRNMVHPADTFVDLLQRSRSVALGAFAHPDVPFERLVELVNPARSTARHPLFQVMLAFQNMAPATLELPGLEVRTEEIDAGRSKFDLQLTMTERTMPDGAPGGIDAQFTYATDLFDLSTVESLSGRLRRIIDAALLDPTIVVGDIELLSESEQYRILREWNATRVAVSPATMVDLFDAQVSRTPDAIALISDPDAATSSTLTYAGFDARANRLARHLIASGVGPESRVALAIGRSVDLLVAMYAVVKAGGAYVPIDTEHPADRIRYVVDASSPVCVLTTTGDTAALPEHTTVFAIDTLDVSGYSSAPVTDLDRRAPLRPENSAYLIFTSGSTGRPKGVEVSHHAAVNLLRWMQIALPITADDRVILKAPVTFDVSVWECFGVLGVGGALIVTRPDGHRDPAYLHRVLTSQRVTIAEFVPSMLDVFLSTPELALPDTLQMIYVGGEAVSRNTADRVLALGMRLGNFYGPTEAAVTTTYHEVLTGETEVNVPIGRPVWNTQAFVLDDRLHPVAVGVPGELYLAGEQLARGYAGRPDLTSDRFVAGPFGGHGDRMYRTGDLVRLLPDGNIDFLGRTDFQVKLRGLRIELGEIEAVLLARDDIDQAAVLVREDVPGQAQLVAYLTGSRDPATGARTQPNLEELRADLGARLPGYMVPTSMLVLPELPVNSTGKLDRTALPVPEFTVAAYRPPRTPVEETVVAVLSEILGTDRVGLDDDFFALGGNSLIATRVAARIGSALGVTVPLRLLFEAPTVVDFASRIDEETAPGTGRPRLAARPRPDIVPLSPAQQRIWFLNQFDPASPAYNLPFSVRFRGPLDAGALSAALGDVVARHETLRTRYPETASGPAQVISSPAEALLVLETEDVTAVNVDDRIVELASAGFDITTELPLRARLLRLAADEHLLVVVMHHIASDGWSVGPLAGDVMRAFAARTEGRDPEFVPLPVQYADYTLWQRELLGNEHDPSSVASRQLDFWRGALTGLPDAIDLPTDRPRPTDPTHHGDVVEFSVPAELHDGIRDLAHARQASVFMVAHAALAVLLHRLSNSVDVAVGTAVSGRGDAALDELIGMFVGTLVLRTQVDSSAAFDEVLTRVRDADLAALGHGDLPFERIVEALDPPRERGRHPLFQVALSLDDTSGTEFTLSGLQTSLEPVDAHIAKFDLQLTLVPQADGGMRGVFTYATDLFDASTVRSFADRYVRILETALADPALPVGDIDILAPRERPHLTPLHPVAEPITLPALLAGAADRDAAPALVHGDDELSYAELDVRSNRLARLLLTHGAGPGTVVALGMPRSVEFVLGMWAVAKTGAAFVAVDPRHPAERITNTIADSGAHLVLTSADSGTLPDSVEQARVAQIFVDAAASRAASYPGIPVDDTERTAPLSIQDVAYLIYTSGSTGRPKGVAVTHAGLGALAHEQRSRFGTSAESRVLHAASPSFDASVFEFVLAFGAGATLVVAPADVVGGEDLAAVIASGYVTHAVVTPAVLGSVDHRGLDHLKTVLLAGDVCPPELVSRWAPGRRIFNGYGPTETTIWATVAGPLSIDEPVTIGDAIAGMRAMVLDARLHPVPDGVAGELYLAGPALARGYLGRTDLTSGRFVADPFAPERGERMYRTGDVVRRRDSALEFVGRTDFQVKIRGLRIELGEIDTALGAHPALEFVTTVGTDDAGNDPVLVSYVKTVPGANVDPAELRAFAGRSLPRYMVPTHVVILDAIPLTPVGKLDRAALPRPEATPREHREPHTATEIAVAGIYRDITDAAIVGCDDNFFELGGNSLSATQVVARVRRDLGVSIAVRDLFDAPTVAGLATRIGAATQDTSNRPALQARTRPERVPLSPAQQRMWFLNRFDPDSPTYNLPLALRLTGGLDPAALLAAVADVTERHESLRTVYPDTPDGPVQRVLSPQSKAATVSYDSVLVADTELEKSVIAFAGQGFDVMSEVPLRLRLFELGPREQVLVLVTHHIAADGWSLAPLAADVAAAYAARTAGRRPDWSPLPIQYADYTLWQHDLLGPVDATDSVGGQQVRFWKETLAGLPEQIDLPSDRSRPRHRTGHGDHVCFEIDPHTHAALDRLAREHGATTFMVVHAALALLLSRVGGGSDIAIGTPVAGRGDALLDPMIGMFVNTLVLRTPIDDSASVGELVDGVRRTDLDAFAHAEIPFERLVELLGPTRSTSRHPLFQVSLTFQNLTIPTLELPDVAVSVLEANTPVSHFDLEFALTESRGDGGRPDGLTGQLSYATDMFDRTTAQSLVDRFVRLLGALPTDANAIVGDVPLLTDTEHRTLVAEWNDTAVATAPAVLPELTDRAAVTTPDAVALTFGDTHLSYREFDHWANQLARTLIRRGVGPEARVGVALRRSTELLVAVHAVLRAGGTYVPLDPGQPPERLTGLIADAEVELVLTASHAAAIPGAELLPVQSPNELGDYATGPIVDAERMAPLRPDNTAYVLFTSGSTGRPKGVAITHGAVVNRLQWMQSQYPIGGGDVVLHKTPTTFDVSVWELLWPLQTGARLVVAAPDGHRDPDYLAQIVHAEQVTVAHFVPSMLNVFLTGRDAPRCTSLRDVIVSGEALQANTAALLHHTLPDTGLHNLYGPTEAAVDVTFHPVPARTESGIPIGTPVWNTEVYVLDRRMHPVPVGAVGELYLAGVQLARGYVGRAALTSERFVANPHGPAGSRLYRTGDMTRWNRHGQLEYLGRNDLQVKLRGQRIELGDVEAALQRVPGVTEAVASVLGDGDDAQLVAHVVGDAEPAVVRESLRHKLPTYLVPSAITVLDAMPLGPNGKLDRKALPAPQRVQREFREPGTPLEHAVTTAFGELLGVDRVSADDDFFELGGTSLLATRVIASVAEATGVNLPTAWLFTDSSATALARRHEAEGDQTATASLDVVLPLSAGTDTLFCIHPVLGLSWCYAGLVRHLPGHGLVGLQSPMFTEDGAVGDIDELADRYVREIRAVQPVGPYRLLGWSLGGVIAQAIAVRLQAAGKTVELLALLDSAFGAIADDGEVPGAAELLGGIPEPFETLTPDRMERIVAAATSWSESLREYRPARFDGDVMYFTAAGDDPTGSRLADNWHPHVSGTIVNHRVDVTHWEMTSPAALDVIGPALAAALDSHPVAEHPDRNNRPEVAWK